MANSVKYLKETRFKEPMVLLPLKQYNALMEYLEDMEDKFSVIERAKEETVPWEKVKKEIRKKLSQKE